MPHSLIQSRMAPMACSGHRTRAKVAQSRPAPSRISLYCAFPTIRPNATHLPKRNSHARICGERGIFACPIKKEDGNNMREKPLSCFVTIQV